MYLPAMRHRVILNFEAEAEGIDPDKVLAGDFGEGAGEGGGHEGGLSKTFECNDERNTPRRRYAHWPGMPTRGRVDDIVVRILSGGFAIG